MYLHISLYAEIRIRKAQAQVDLSNNIAAKTLRPDKPHRQKSLQSCAKHYNIKLYS